MAIILLSCGPCEVILNCLGQVLYLGRAPHTNETLPDFHEWCRVTRHPRLFRRLTGCQRTPQFWGVTADMHMSMMKSHDKFENETRTSFNNQAAQL